MIYSYISLVHKKCNLSFCSKSTIKKWACAGMSDLMSGTCNKSCIEFKNIHAGKSGPAHNSISRMMHSMVSVAISVASKGISICSFFSVEI